MGSNLYICSYINSALKSVISKLNLQLLKRFCQEIAVYGLEVMFRRLLVLIEVPLHEILKCFFLDHRQPITTSLCNY